MRIILGSESGQKIEILRSFLGAHGVEGEVTGVRVCSGVADQPLGRAETRAGAANRARAAQRSGECDLGVGLEGGLELGGKIYHLVCAAVLRDGKGGEYVGESEPVPLPLEVSRAVGRGEPFGRVIRAWAAQPERTPEERVAGEALIGRRAPLLEALERAWAKLPS